jgi:hypothetical protein
MGQKGEKALTCNVSPCSGTAEDSIPPGRDIGAFSSSCSNVAGSRPYNRGCFRICCGPS